MFQSFFFVYQLTGKIENMKIGILQEGFGLRNSEADVDKMVREAAGQLGTKCGAIVEEVSIPMHYDGNCHDLIIMSSNFACKEDLYLKPIFI